MKVKFADRLILATRKLGPLCVGIDPHPARIPDLFGGDTPAGITAWGEAIVANVAGRVAAIKPQAGLFERHGPEGMSAMQRVIRAGREAGLIVLVDAKRGDIGSTAQGYAQAYLASGAPFECDAVTVNPYMGLDTLEPFVRCAEETGRGVIVLTRTSNPGSADFQSRNLDGRPLYLRVAQALTPFVQRLQGETGWSGLMMVTGATGPDEAREIRALAPDALFLVPGYGAQGAGAADAMAGFRSGPSGPEGGLVSASRSVTMPSAAQSASNAKEWDKAINTAIESAKADLATI